VHLELKKRLTMATAVVSMVLFVMVGVVRNPWGTVLGSMVMVMMVLLKFALLRLVLLLLMLLVVRMSILVFRWRMQLCGDSDISFEPLIKESFKTKSHFIQSTVVV